MRTLGALLLVGCATVPGPQATEDARRSLLAAHAQERETHFARDADRIAALSSEGFVLVDSGEIRPLTVAEQRAHFAGYFARVTFERWDDLEPPRVWISADGSWGSIAVRKEVVTRSVADGSVDRTVFAWLETWEHGPRGWQLRALASTRAPAAER
ncbi:MAG TPA: hypothetical protein VLT82_05245 [Myxococcaceae bacterium]|nr:hypothetical protein [Myxococcaceae bacterium]